VSRDYHHRHIRLRARHRRSAAWTYPSPSSAGIASSFEEVVERSGIVATSARELFLVCGGVKFAEAQTGYGDTFRVTEDNLHFRGPLALKVPLACQFAVVLASTLATAAKPSPTPLPAESVNFTWIV
jgi:hypothetical protein